MNFSKRFSGNLSKAKQILEEKEKEDATKAQEILEKIELGNQRSQEQQLKSLEKVKSRLHKVETVVQTQKERQA